ncbi:MAG: hypothetical protein WKF79_10825 [Nocardioides sp.]
MAVRWFPGAERILTAQAVALPQPDQLCGPFAARAALHALLPAAEVPTLVALADASGTSVWPHDVPQWRPPGAPLDRTGWHELPTAATPEASGTDAAPLADGVRRITAGAIAVVAVNGAGAWSASSLDRLLHEVADATEPTAVLANVHTGPLMADLDARWEVGHFVVLVGLDERDPGRVVVADSYAELGLPGWPPGCRAIPLEALAEALAAPPGRGLLLLGAADRHAELETWVASSGHTSTAW